MNGIIKQFSSLEQVTGAYLKQQSKEEKPEGTSFENILKEKKLANLDDKQLVFSKHANMRLQHRNIRLSDGQMQRLYDGVEQAREKNIRESLVMVDDISFIVNVPNNTVVTAMSGEDEQKIFTNIDGAVIS